MATINNTSVFDFSLDNASRAPFLQGQHQLSLIRSMTVTQNPLTATETAGQLWPRGKPQGT